MTPQERRTGVALALLGAAAIALATLIPAARDAGNPGHLCLVCGDRGGIDAFLNVLLFVPLGAGLRLAGLRPWRALALAFAATVAIELLQVTVVTGRDASVGDVVWNSTGAAIGIWLAPWWRTLLLPAPRVAARLTMAGALLALLVFTVSGWMTLPSGPAAQAFGQWRPPHGRPAAGRVLAAEWNGVPMPDGPIAARDAERIGATPWTRLTADFVPDHPTRFVRAVVAAADGSRRGLWSVALGTAGVIFRVRTKADDARFRTPGIRLPVLSLPVGASAPLTRDVLAWRAGDTLHLQAERTRDSLRVRLTDGVAVAEGAVPVTLTRGWLNIVPGHPVPGTRGDPVTILWLAMVLAPLAWWAGAAARSPGTRWALLLPPAVVVAAFAGLTRAFGLARPPAAEWIGALIGAALVAACGVAVSAWGARRGAANARRAPGVPLH